MKNYELAKTTPMMRQWFEIKQTMKNDEIVFCRVGDFYELFYDDAIRASKLLDIQLTKRRIGDTFYEMAGVPYRSLDNYVARLVKMGYRVAIIDQLEDAKQTKGTIKRGLTRIITKGTITETSMLTPDRSNYLAALVKKKTGKTSVIGFAVCDLSTGDFRAQEFSEEEFNALLRAYMKFSPVEVLVSQDIDAKREFNLSFDNDEVITPISDHWLNPEYAKNEIYSQFNVRTTKGFGFDDNSMATGASGAIIKYLKETQLTEIPHIMRIHSFDISDTMTLDATAIKSLELFENTQDHSSYATLVNLMDETSTAMGSRLIKHWIANPLANKNKIEERLNAVELLLKEPLMHHQLRSILREVDDIERLVTRISMKRARPEELIKLAISLEAIPQILDLINPYLSIFSKEISEKIDPCYDIVDVIRKAINDEPGNALGEGKVIRYGFNSQLDSLIDIIKKGNNWLDEYIEREKKKTGIYSLKIKQNNVLGYFIEISKKDISKVPEYFVKKQVMVNTSRYITEELKNWETEVLDAEVKILDIETAIYNNILEQLSEYTDIMQQTSHGIAVLDSLSSLAYIAERNGYSRPTIRDDRDLIIHGGRHPVIESLIDNPYVANDVSLFYDSQRIIIITGPNFSGKSSLLRMTALLTIMAQVGSFVPADKMELGIVDRIFTRIGASDNLVAGQSTFMMEMVDAANLVNNSTSNSLIIADELGRGTSTYDGLAIAWSITEYLHNDENSPKILIATHYHQLAELEDILKHVKNYHFSISFKGDQPIFDHKLRRGSSDKSFGVEVAKLAGLPKKLIDRARYILKILESKAADVNPDGVSNKRISQIIVDNNAEYSFSNWFEDIPVVTDPSDPELLNRANNFDEILLELKSIDVNTLTPIDALNKLQELKSKWCDK